MLLNPVVLTNNASSPYARLFNWLPAPLLNIEPVICNEPDIVCENNTPGVFEPVVITPPSVATFEPLTCNEPDMLTEPVKFELPLLSIRKAFLLAPAPVPLPTTNTVSCELSCNEPVALYLPTITVPPTVVDVCDADTIKFEPNSDVAVKCPADDVA